MNHLRSKYYNDVNQISNGHDILDMTKCPICEMTLTDMNIIEFVIHNKRLKVCSYPCMIRTKKLYNYLILN